jgi:hypothetical protein
MSYLHNWPIVNGWFWYGKIWPTYYKWSIFDMNSFWHLVWTNLMSSKFSLYFFFFFLIPLFMFLI